MDTDDASVAHAYYVELLGRAGLALAHTALQRNFPKGLYKVRMYAARPSGSGGAAATAAAAAAGAAAAGPAAQ